jgi:GAF domain-containing protein
MARQTLETLVASAVDVTSAALGLVARVDGDALRVVSAVGSAATAARAGELVDHVLAPGGTAAFVVGSGQPIAAQPGAGDTRASDDAVLLGGTTPTSVLCVPCVWDDEVIGALQLMNKAGGGSFSFDDVEVATVLGTIAGAALAEGVEAVGHRSAAELGNELRRLEGADPAAFHAVATVVEALLARS